MTENILTESLFLAENTMKIIYSSHEIQKEFCFNSGGSLSNKFFLMKRTISGKSESQNTKFKLKLWTCTAMYVPIL